MLLLAATLTGRWNRHTAAVEVFANFPMQYLLMGFVLVVAALLLHSRAWVPAALVVAINAAVVLPFMPYQALRSRPPAWPHLRLMTANVLYNNHDFSGLCHAVAAIRPDVVVMQEVTDDFDTYFTDYFRTRYPFVVRVPSRNDNVILAASGRPMRLDTTEMARTGVMHLLVQTRRDTVHLFCVHPETPLTPATHNARTLSLNHAFGQAQGHAYPVILLGDFNIGAFTPVFLDYEKQSKLRSMRRGQGLFPTFNARTPVAFQIPIDHILTNQRIRTLSFQSFVLPGSDHKGLWADVRIGPRP